MSRFVHSLLVLHPREAEFARRGFTCSQPAVREHLERIGKTFIRGYNAGLTEPNQQKLTYVLEEIPIEFRGFAYEGAAMAFTLLDGIAPWRRRFSSFLAGPGGPHIYMLHVGAGWAFARLPWLRRRIETVIRKLDPVLGWLAIDGYGFHEGYFHWNDAFQPKIATLSPDARHVFYQGLGRSLWFVKGADPAQIECTIASFAPEYRADAWSGIGLACAYAGGVNATKVHELYRRGASYESALAQGAAFAAKTRLRAGNLGQHTAIACRAFCGVSAEEAAALCDETLSQVPGNHPSPYQYWRELLQERFRNSDLELQQEQIAILT